MTPDLRRNPLTRAEFMASLTRAIEIEPGTVRPEIAAVIRAAVKHEKFQTLRAALNDAQAPADVLKYFYPAWSSALRFPHSGFAHNCYDDLRQAIGLWLGDSE